jgi:hypothetical protein
MPGQICRSSRREVLSPSQIASNMPNHADHAGRLLRSTERPALKSP